MLEKFDNFRCKIIDQHNTKWNMANFVHCLRGVQAFQILKHDFELFLGDDGLDMYQQPEGGFRSMRIARNIAHAGHRIKNKSKTKTKRNKMELKRNSIRLDKLIILVWSDVKIG